MTIKICVSILPTTIDEALEFITKAETKCADFIEVRLDLLDDLSLSEIADRCKAPIIATSRSIECGGKFRGSEAKRREILLNAAKSGFEYVDIELHSFGLRDIVSQLYDMGVKPIISFHDFNGTPHSTQLFSIFEQEIANKAEICKIVTTARSINDNLKILDFTSEASEKAKIVCFAMGSLGRLSRILSPIFGGFFTIASLEGGKETAEGQLSIDSIRSIYRDLGFIT